MKKAPLSFEQWITKLVENLASQFDLAGWLIHVEFPTEEKESAYADNTIDSTYLYSTLRFYPASRKDFVEGNVNRLVMAAAHELIHLFLDPFQDAIHPFLSPTTTPAFMEILEQQTQKLTMVFLKNLPKNLIPPR